jgi:hypothetical protein
MVVETTHPVSNVEFSVTVLTDAYWPVYKDLNLQLPKSVSSQWD